MPRKKIQKKVAKTVKKPVQNESESEQQLNCTRIIAVNSQNSLVEALQSNTFLPGKNN